MSERNLEAARRWLNWEGLKAHERRDRLIGDLQRLVDDVWAEDCDYYPVRALPGAQAYHGREAVKAFMTDFWESWAIWEVELVDLEAIDEVRALGQTHVRAVGKGSGITLDGAVFHCFWFRDGRILRCEDHQTERGARVGLGLESAP